MSQGINLLKGKKSPDYLLENTVKKAKLISFILLIVYLIVGVGMLVYWFNLTSQKNQVRQLTESKKQSITGLNKVEYSLVALKQRLEFFQKAKQRSKINFGSAIEQIYSLEIPGTSIDSLVIKNDGSLNIKGKAGQSINLADFIKGLVNQKKQIKKMVLESLTRLPDGSYDFELNLILEQNLTS